MAALEGRAFPSYQGGITLVTLMFICLVHFTGCVAMKKFTFKNENGSDYEVSYPRSMHGDCIYDNSRDLAICMKNHKYDSVISKWKYKPKAISYISVNCRRQRIYTHHRGKCVCKDFNMAARPHRGTQKDSYSFCQLEIVHRGMMSKLVNLQVLDLSHNEIFRLPRNVFDDLHNLKALFLSNNPLLAFSNQLLCHTDNLTTLVARSLPITTFPQNMFQCFADFKSNLSVIDLSHSKISEIKEGDFRHLENLRNLDLSYNNINVIHPESFSDLVSLQHLDISGNTMPDIPDMFCLGMSNIKTMNVRHNNLVLLNLTKFKQCENLEHLDLSVGHITGISETPVDMLNLQTLNISSNNISALIHPLFIKAPMLKYLDVSNNDIQSILDDALKGMANLESLYLDNNLLTDLDDIFMANLIHVVHLRHLTISGNLIQSIHNETFKSLSALIELDLSFNRLERIHKNTFIGLISLERLKLRNNAVSHVQGDDMAVLEKLTVLDFSQNKLKTVSGDFPPSLLKLDLSFNELTKLPKMHGLVNLRELSLKGNALSSVTDDDFKGMANLKELDLSENGISFLGKHCFASMMNLQVLLLRDNYMRLEISHELFERSLSMRRLDLSHNNVTVTASLFTRTSLVSLEELDLSYNPLGSINEALKNNVSSALKWLNLEFCNIMQVDEDAFAYMPLLEQVNLRHNLIRAVPLFNAHLGAMFYFQGNPVLCTCGMNWLIHPWVETKSNKKLSTYDYVVDTCRIFPSMNKMSVRELQNIDFLCPETHFCPPECECFVLEEGGSVYLSVCRGNLTSIPHNLPHESEFLYLDGNTFGALTRISTRQHYTENLFLNNSGITSLTGNAFQNFVHVFHLDVSYNHIHVLPVVLLHGLENLQTLNLSHNSIQHLEEGLFRNVPDLQTIDVSFNRLHRILPGTLHEINSLTSFRWIHLSNNAFICACDNHDFWHWIHESHSRIFDRKHVFCDGVEMRRVDSKTFECSHFPSSLMCLIISVCVLAVLVPLLVLTVRCREEISAVWFTRVTSLIRNRNGGDSDSETFETMVLYDAQDLKCSWWVHKSLLPKLSEWRKRAYIPCLDSESRDTISRNVRTCKSVIALMTHRFKDCAAGADILDEFVASHGRVTSVILVSWGYFDKASIPACLKRDVISCNFLPITAMCFWDKLFYRMSKILQQKDRGLYEGETTVSMEFEDSHM